MSYMGCAYDSENKIAYLYPWMDYAHRMALVGVTYLRTDQMQGSCQAILPVF